MSTITTPETHISARAPAVPNDYIWRLSVGQYHDMIRQGILMDGDPVELLEGWLVVKMTKKPPHCLSTSLSRENLERLIQSIPDWFVNGQAPITLEDSEPEPDISVIRGQRRDYADRHPGPPDVGMVVEVSEGNLPRDKVWKKSIYAKSRVPIYWIVNLVDRKVEVYSEPSGPSETPDYAKRQDFGPGESVPVVLDRREIGKIAVNDLLV
jgi:Uma2 family endonuclease